MKTRPAFLRNSRGSILMVTLVLSFTIGIVLLSCLSLVKSQNQAVARSQAWNACIPVIEAGIEEAMAHLNNQRETTYTVNGWTQDGVVYWRERALGDSFYSVNITLADPLRPVIVCTGYVRMPVLVAEANGPLLADSAVGVDGLQYICRAVQVVAQRHPTFAKAMVAKESIDMNGNNIQTDSFDSMDPNHSTLTGGYDPAKASDKGDVATLSGLADSLGVGNANIKGHVQTGAGGSIDIGPGGVVGSMDWHNAGNTGIQPGWWSDDLNVYFPDVERPFNGGAFVPTSGSVTGYVYKYLLTDGNYELSNLTLASKEKMAITGNAVLLVDGNVTVIGGIDILPGGSLKLYVAGANTVLGGSGVNNTGRATNFVYYGLPSNTSFTLPSNGDFIGAIYAPSCNFTLSGGGSTDLNFCGACVTRTVGVNGHYKFHYDESLGRFGPWRDFVIISWVEL